MDWIGIKPGSELHYTESQFLPHRKKAVSVLQRPSVSVI